MTREAVRRKERLRRRSVRQSWLVLIALGFAVSACPADGPKFVYVPESPPDISLDIRASDTTVRVGAPVILGATRRTQAAWVRVERATLDSSKCWTARPYPEHEADVADNVRWEATPAGGARFNVGLNADHSRVVVFDAPGEFVLRAHTVGWCNLPPVSAQPLSVRVDPL